jgi:acyl-CoA synthetase (NDP forming)
VEERIAERDHRAAVASLRAILAPEAIAVVGASRRSGSAGHGVLANVLDGGFAGVATPVSRSGGVVRSIRVAERLADLPETPDLVIIAVPADDVLEVAGEAAAKGARALLVLSEGFAETGDAGRERQEQLLELVRSAGMRLVGPNSLGVTNTDPAVSLNATVAGAAVPAGRLAVCSQSGAIGLGLLGHASARRLGISSFASLGNRADVSTNDLLEYWEDDDRTAAVMLYVQTFGNPERFTRIARRVSQRKPILVVKGLRMAAGKDGGPVAHRRRDAGGRVVDALLRHAGVLRFRSGDELFNAAEFFEAQPLPRGRRIGVVTNSTGLADARRGSVPHARADRARAARNRQPLDPRDLRRRGALRRRGGGACCRRGRRRGHGLLRRPGRRRSRFRARDDQPGRRKRRTSPSSRPW